MARVVASWIWVDLFAVLQKFCPACWRRRKGGHRGQPGLRGAGEAVACAAVAAPHWLRGAVLVSPPRPAGPPRARPWPALWPEVLPPAGIRMC